MRSASHTFTRFVQFNPQVCQACWQCIGECPREVLGKVSFWGHEHVHVNKPEACIGCKKCLKICPNQAIKEINDGSVIIEHRRKRHYLSKRGHKHNLQQNIRVR